MLRLLLERKIIPSSGTSFMLPPSGGGTRQLFIVFYRSLFAYVCRPGDGWGEALGASRISTETRETRREREISNVLICSIIIRRDAVHRFRFYTASPMGHKFYRRQLSLHLAVFISHP